MKVGLIVEGDSDKEFFEKYFKPNLKRNILVSSPGKKGTCKILNREKIDKDIKMLFAKGCQEIYILIDLDTQCDDGKKFNCIIELKEWYSKKISLNKHTNVYVSVVSKEIEAWMLSAWQKSDNKSKQDFEKIFKSKKSLNELELLKKFIASKKAIDEKNNESLYYFLKKLGLVEKCN